MSVFERAVDDERSGDLGSARRRMMSFIASHGYDASAIESIARLSIRMRDLREAGRWYFLCESQDAEAPDAIERFTRSCHRDARQIASQLPLERVANIPAFVHQRLATFDPPRPAPPQSLTTPPRGWRSRAEERLTCLGCVLVFLAVSILALIGAADVIGFFVK